MAATTPTPSPPSVPAAASDAAALVNAAWLPKPRTAADDATINDLFRARGAFSEAVKALMRRSNDHAAPKSRSSKAKRLAVAAMLWHLGQLRAVAAALSAPDVDVDAFVASAEGAGAWLAHAWSAANMAFQAGYSTRLGASRGGSVADAKRASAASLLAAARLLLKINAAAPALLRASGRRAGDDAAALTLTPVLNEARQFLSDAARGGADLDALRVAMLQSTCQAVLRAAALRACVDLQARGSMEGLLALLQGAVAPLGLAGAGGASAAPTPASTDADARGPAPCGILAIPAMMQGMEGCGTALAWCSAELLEPLLRRAAHLLRACVCNPCTAMQPSHVRSLPFLRLLAFLSSSWGYWVVAVDLEDLLQSIIFVDGIERETVRLTHSFVWPLVRLVGEVSKRWCVASCRLNCRCSP